MEYLKEDINQARKILFTGLDTAGKTSIILALKKEFSKIAVVSPTKGAQRRIFDFLNIEISEWDLGGQKSYRISYLKNPDKYFDNTDIAVFVIDIQNMLRIPEAISYLNDVITQFYKLKLSPPINILFHKYDPNLSEGIRKNWDELISNLEKKIKREIQYEKLSFYTTSVYDLPSILFTISEILLNLYPKAQLITKTIGEFCLKINCNSMVILDENSIILGSYFKDEKSERLIERVLPYFFILDNEFKDHLGEDPKEQIIVQRANYYFVFKRFSLKKVPSSWYLILLKKGYYFFEDTFDSLINMLELIIYKDEE